MLDYKKLFIELNKRYLGEMVRCITQTYNVKVLWRTSNIYRFVQIKKKNAQYF